MDMDVAVKDAIFLSLKVKLSSDSVNLNDIKQSLNEITKSCLEKKFRHSLNKENIAVIVDGLLKFVAPLEKDITCISLQTLHCLTECYRALRNICADCYQNQCYVSELSQCFVVSADLVSLLTKYINEDPSCKEQITLVLRCLVQFLGNAVTGHRGNQDFVCRNILLCLRTLVEYGDEKLTNFTCMVLHNCLVDMKENREDPWLKNSRELWIAVIKAITSTDCEFGLFLIEDMIQISSIICSIQAQLSEDEMLLVLEILIDKLKKMPDKAEATHVPFKGHLQYLATEFKEKSKDIPCLTSEGLNSDKMSYITVKQLEALGLALSHHELYGELKEDTDLLTCSIYLLHGIQQLGKQSENSFTNVDKLTKRDKVDTEHPVYGLKRDLIRLIGNMVHEHKGNQDTVREMDGMALILDQTNIDGRNPFITQWAILAIRNLCYNNPENQAVLAALKMEGIDRNVSVLEELGIEAEVKGDKVYVKSKQK